MREQREGGVRTADIYNNCAQCHRMLGNFERCLEAAGRAQEVQPTNYKSYYLAAVALIMLSQARDADWLEPLKKGIANLRTGAQG